MKALITTGLVLLMALACAGHMGEKTVASVRRTSRIRGHLHGRGGQGELALGPAGEVRAFESPFNINPKRCGTGFLHVGCANDVQEYRRRNYRDWVPKEDRRPMTVDLCWNFCKNVSGAQYFALTHGDRCYCTPHYHDNFDYGDEVCDQPCHGNKQQMCGGQRLMDIYEMHDCGNVPPVPCTRPPPPVQNAKLFDSKAYKGKVPCKNAINAPLDTMTSSLCEVECEEGFYLTNNSLACVEKGDRLTYSWSQIIGSAQCQPVNCGLPEAKENAKYPQIEKYYHEEATYSCNLGYTTNATAQGIKIQDAQCLGNQQFSEVHECQKVTCGECPSGPKYPNATFQEKGGRFYQDACTYDCHKGFTLNHRPDGEKQFSIACLATGEFSEPPTCSAVACGAAPTVQWANPITAIDPEEVVVYPQVVKYKCESGYSLDASAKGKKEFDVECGVSGIFTKPPECKPVSNGKPPKVDNSDYHDREYFYPQGVTYICLLGHTLTGKPGDPDTKTIFAGPEGVWLEPAQQCLPVECGPPPSIAHAELNGTAPGVVTYSSDPLEYICAPGYSTVANDDIWDRVEHIFLASCQANGEFSKKECVNIDDCLIRECGTYGTCEDLPNPTGKTIDDYTCNCESGYEITLHESILKVGEKRKLCTNIMDCPAPVEEACGGRNADEIPRGSCTDGINVYTCICGAGYKNGESSAGNDTCVPIDCGTVSAIGNTTCEPDMVGKEANFDTPAWKFTCVEGYTLDGKSGGAKSFDMSCTSTGALSSPQSCKPVSCGAPTLVGNADMAPATMELSFGEHVLYTCDEGYALKGDPKGLREFQVDCLSSGDLSLPDTSPGGEPVVETPATEPGGQPKPDTGTVTATTTPLSCLPVICGLVPEQKHATWNKTKEVTYGRFAKIDCDDGYSIDESPSSDSDSYKAYCQSDGSFKIEKECTRIRCGDPPDVAHTSHEPDGPYYYEDVVTYKLEPGFSVTVPGEGEVNDTFKCHCAANGKFDGACAKDLKVSAINCGTAPVVAHATVTGETYFGGVMKAIADQGYSLDGSPEGQKEFTFFCQANGRFSPRQEFQRIECGLCEEWDNVLSMDFIEKEEADALLQLTNPQGRHLGLKVRHASSSTLKLARVNRTRRMSRRLYSAAYGDMVDYLCAEGYRAKSAAVAAKEPVSVEEPKDFMMRCTDNGDFAFLGDASNDTNCEPITCEIKKASASDFHEPVFPGPTVFFRPYLQAQQYTCKAGYSLDGKPSDETKFVETCTATGEMSKQHACQDIDYCLIGECGPNGDCVDGELGYTCSCNAGYQVTYVDSSLQTCTQINECLTLDGDSACSVGGGSCTDKTLGYECVCAKGYQNTPISGNRDSCAPVMCPAAPAKEFASCDKAGQKLSFTQSTVYTCDTGYTTDGTATGDSTFSMTCGADRKLTNADKACKPVACPEAPLIGNSSISGNRSTHFGQVVSYKCSTGYTTTGTAKGSATFRVACLADGTLAAAEACLPVSCGAPPAVVSAKAPETVAAEVTYGEKLAYMCLEGYTIDGTAEGAQSFTGQCEADGTLSGMKSCRAVSCGRFEGVEHGQSSHEEQWYPSTFPVVCKTGYTVDSDPDGESTFMVKCGAKGKFENVGACTPVTCGVPLNTEGATVPKVEKFFKETATWTCKKGYSLDGKATGGTTFKKLCESSGAYAHSSPSDCVDIDFCAGSPCKNGVCTDKGPGVPYPGYSCECYEGYEMKLNSDGSERCSADDCAGDPCGEGGTCSDLSKTGGPQGTYACNCDEGYEVVNMEDSKQTCVRASCGLPPLVKHTTELGYKVTTWKGEPVKVDPVHERPIMESFDVATYTCAPGYSTDGGTSPESRTFSVGCGAHGSLQRPLEPDSECQPVVCDNEFLPTIQNSEVEMREERFVFGKVAKFNCVHGYTLSGLADGESSLSLKCIANGQFSSTSASCLPVLCPSVPAVANAVASVESQRYGGGSVWYSCKPGYYLEGIASEMNMNFEGMCGPDGNIFFPEHSEGAPFCERAFCGDVPEQPDAVLGGGPDGDASMLRTTFGMKCLEYGLTDHLVWMRSCSGNENQMWYFDGSWLRSRHDHSCLAVEPTGGSLHLATCAETADQEWSFKDGKLQAKSSTKCLDENKDKQVVAMKECTGGSNQLWYIASQSYPVKSKHDGKCLHYSKTDKLVHMLACNGESNQEWYWLDGELKVMSDDLCLDYDYNSESKRLAMHSCLGLPNQKWSFSDGKLKSSKEDLCIQYDLGEGMLSMRPCSGESNQVWFLAKDAAPAELLQVPTTGGGKGEPLLRRGAVPRADGGRGTVFSQQFSSVGPARSGLRFGDVQSYRCKSGFTLGGVLGGDEDYEVTCQANGKLSGEVLVLGEILLSGGPPPEKGPCRQIRVKVEGVVTDAQDARLKIGNAKATFWQGGSQVGAASSNYLGRYSALIPQGLTTIKVEPWEHHDYISKEKGPFDIQVDVKPGQYADFGLSKPLGADDWRIVLNWGGRPLDLDSHTYFGCDLAQHVSLASGGLGSSERAGGLQVSLDRDATMGYGPETTTITNSGKCSEVGCCLIKFKVNHFRGEGSGFSDSGNLASSEAIVTVYQGMSEVQKYKVPACIGDADWWTVLTIDATSGHNKLYIGDMLRAPYISPLAVGKANWATSFDSARWSVVESALGGPAVVMGLHLEDRANLHRLEAASYYEVKGISSAITCQDVNWEGKLGKEEWVVCPDGTYLSGLYRGGTKYDGLDGIEQLSAGRCCKLETTTAGSLEPAGGAGLMMTGFNMLCMTHNLENQNVFMYDCNRGAANEMWYFDGNHLKTKHSEGMCLAIEAGSSNVVMAACAETASQEWRSEGGKLMSGSMCLAEHVEDQNVFVSACQEVSNQQWYMTSRTYPIRTKHDGKCLAYKKEDSTVDVLTCNGEREEQFYWLDGAVKVVGEDLCLDYDFNSKRLYMHECHGSSTQLWYFSDWLLKSKRDNLCMTYDLDAGGVRIRACSAENNQKWYMAQDGGMGGLIQVSGATVESEWGECHEQPIEGGTGNLICTESDSGSATAMVGLHASMMPGTLPAAASYDGPLAIHARSSKGVYIGGKYIEVGFRTDYYIGKMGTSESPPAGFSTRARGRLGVGMTADDVGFADDPYRKYVIDYFLPGAPEESFWAGFKVRGLKKDCNNCGSSVEDTSPGGPVASTRTKATLRGYGGSLSIVQDVTLGVNDRFFKNVITLKNTGTETLTDVRYMRSHDPDPTVDQYGSYTTNQKQEATYDVDGFSAVSATSKPYDRYYSNTGGKRAVVMYYSTDPRAKASFGLSGLKPYRGVYDYRVYDMPARRGETSTKDAYISMCFEVGTLAPGQETTMEYYTALDARPVSEVIAEVAAAALPVLTLDKMKCCAVKPRPLTDAGHCEAST